MKTRIIRLGLMLVFASCFITMHTSDYGLENNNPVFNNSKNKLETIVYNADKGIEPSSLIKNIKRLEIYDRKQNKIVSINKFNSTIYLNSLKPGKYILKMETNAGETFSKALIKL